MKKDNLFTIKYMIFIFICFLPLFVEAALFDGMWDLGEGNRTSNINVTLGYNEIYQLSWPTQGWKNLNCGNGSGVHWTETKSGNYYFYIKSNNNTVNAKTLTATCTIVEYGKTNNFFDKLYTYNFNITLNAYNTATPIQKAYNIFKGDTVNLKSDLKVKKITAFSHNTGSGYGTIKNSGCSTASGGTGDCSLVFNTGTALQDRQHKFTLTFVGTNDVLYQATVYAYEMDTIRNLELGAIEPGETVYGGAVDGATDFSCKNSTTGVPATVTKSGNKIKVTSNNNSLEGYSGEAVCTFKKDSKTYTYNYTYSLNPQTAKNVTKKYNAYPKDVIDLYKDLSIKSIISFTGEYNTARLSYSGCSKSSSSCKLTMASKLKTGDSHTFTMYYHDTLDVLKKASITVVEQSDSTTNDLDDIGAGSMVKVDINASDVTCTTVSSSGTIVSGGGEEESGSSSLFEIIIEKISEWLFGVTIKNNNQTVIDYEDITVVCTGVPENGDGREHNYVYNFDLSGSNTPVKNTKSYVLFSDDVLNFNNLLGIKTAKTVVHGTGSSYKSLIINGCSNTTNCSVSLDKSKMEHNREHELTLTYINNADVLYETKVHITEKDPAETTKAYPGLFGFCEFDSDWELNSWADSSGKNYTFYESKAKNSVLPRCKVDSLHNTENLPVEFKGWTKGYKPGDTLTTKSTCGTNLLAPGKKTDFGQTYAPCYEMKPHIRVSINSGTLKNASGFEFRPSDLTYIKLGSSFTEKVKLPDVEYSGFHSNNKLESWINYSTGEVKKPGDEVVLDGSVWYATSSKSLASMDLYKTVGYKEVSIFTVENMKKCALAASSSYISVENNSGDCKVKGLKVTPVDEYADVVVELKDGTTRTYRFSVIDRSGIADDDNGVFIVDTEDNVEIGENDEATLNGFKTNQCNDFFITIENYDKYHFANSKDANIAMYTGKFEVYQLCADDNANYVALCLDPGRRGPQEPTSGAYKKKFTSKGKEYEVSGLDYVKSSEIHEDTLLGKLVTYIVNSSDYDIATFDSTYGSGDTEKDTSARRRRAAAHVAIRSIAMIDGVSLTPDKADPIYESSYYPYLKLSNAIKKSFKNGTLKEDIDGILDNTGFTGWDSSVRSLLKKTLLEFNTSKTAEENQGFTRTIDETDYTVINSGKGYQIDYKGTITVPKGATATMEACSKGSKYKVSCSVLSWTEKGSSDDRITYEYKVRVKVSDAAKFVPPTTTDHEKDLSFKITYTGGHDIVNSFIATPKNGSANVQRMLIFSTTNPMIYIYFSVLPKDCELGVLNPDNCKNKTECSNNIADGKFNRQLFKAAGCCRYLLDQVTYKYLYETACTAECTTSTLTQVCEYTKSGKDKADFYEIKEGSHGSTELIDDADDDGKNTGCIVNTQDFYINDKGKEISSSHNSAFIRTDDNSNVINVEHYRNNKYCQVTCKEDWQFTMDSFGNFVGANAVAAGTYFQIVSNDVFIGAKRTCYTTFINYDRFMNNLVELSDKLVKYYNSYSTWSHVWTDIDRQVHDDSTKDTVGGTLSYDDSGQGVVCAEYWNECPSFTTNYQAGKGTYFWEASQADGTTGGCLQVPNYGDKDEIAASNCTAKPSDHSTGEDDYHDYKITYTNNAKNDYTTMCSFERRYCDGNDEPYGEEEYNTSTKKCDYYDYELRKTKSKVYEYQDRYTASKEKKSEKRFNWNAIKQADGTYLCTSGNLKDTKCYSSSCPIGYPNDGGIESCYKYECPSNYDEISGTCYYNSCPSGYESVPGSLTRCRKSVCPSGTTEVGGVCYVNGSAGCESGYSDYSGTGSTKYCRKWTSTSSHTVTLKMRPAYNKTYLRCKVFGKGYDFTLTTETKNNRKVKGKGDDVYYTTKQYDKLASEGKDNRDSIANKGTGNRQNEPVKGKKVSEVYSKTYTHNCTLTAANYSPGKKGSSYCEQSGLVKEAVGVDSYSKTDEMFCIKYAQVDGKDKAFCRVGNASTSKNEDGKKGNEGTDYAKTSDAFAHIKKSFMDHALLEANSARSSMVSYHSKIYDHAIDLYDCQNFELHNRTDDSDASRKNNPISVDSILKMKRNYVNINTDFDPTATYTYDEDFFMSRVADENVLIQYTEKNDEAFGGIGKYASSTNVDKDVSVTVPDATDSKGKTVKTKLSRNKIVTSYYNPINPWSKDKRSGDSSNADAINRLNSYHDDKYVVATPEKATKYITLCTVGSHINPDTVAEGGKDQIVFPPFVIANAEWIAGSCYKVKVDYKKVHYVKTSLSNSSYYKNKGYWYVRGGDSKIHGDTISDAIKKFNGLNLGSTFKNNDKEHKNWSRLGSFNVFPISMATPRNLYQYSYTFGNVGSYYDGALGRIMGKDNSIIQNNKRTCFYEVFEEVCLCCGYLVEPGDLVEQVVDGYGSYKDYKYVLSNTSKTGEGTHGTITFYSNSISLGDVDLGRNSDTLASNWSKESPFMYNGNVMLTDKGDKLIQIIESAGENVYSSKPEYAYYLTPDTLQEIRSYNKSVGYDMNLERLYVADVKKIECDGYSCKDGTADDISFQHYGSNFLKSPPDGINLNSTGVINSTYTNVCSVKDSSLNGSFNMAAMMDSGKCRWVDYIETEQYYHDPTKKTGTKEITWFRLAFK